MCGLDLNRLVVSAVTSYLLGIFSHLPQESNLPHVNEQPIEKLDRSPDGTLDVHSIFYTIQGEGPFCGRPAIFIRLAGCNLQCPGCDTDYTTTRTRHSVAIVMAKVYDLKYDEYPEAPKPLVVITGGEPFRQNILYLVRSLVREGYAVQVETNGTLPVPDEWPKAASIVVSPKLGKIQDSIASRMVALKYVVQAGAICRDGLPARALELAASPTVAKPPNDYNGPIYIQPMDEGNLVANRRNTQAAIRSCLQNGHILQVQVHKTIGVE